MSTSSTPFSVDKDDINFEYEAPASKEPVSNSAPVKSVDTASTNSSTSQNADSSSKASLRAKLLSAAQNAAPAYTPSMAAAVPAYTPSTTTSAVAEAPSQSQQQNLKSSNDDFDPNNFELSGSGDYPPPADDYYYDDYQGPPTDSESFNLEEEDDDHTRDLCSTPCSQCGTVPSYVVYELCMACLDKVGPQ